MWGGVFLPAWLGGRENWQRYRECSEESWAMGAGPALTTHSPGDDPRLFPPCWLLGGWNGESPGRDRLDRVSRQGKEPPVLGGAKRGQDVFGRCHSVARRCQDFFRSCHSMTRKQSDTVWKCHGQKMPRWNHRVPWCGQEGLWHIQAMSWHGQDPLDEVTVGDLRRS